MRLLRNLTAQSERQADTRRRMDLTIPYTFYPLVLPGWISWTLFLIATAGGITIGVARGSRRGWKRGLYAGVVGVVGLLFATMVASMIITFFLR